MRTGFLWGEDGQSGARTNLAKPGWKFVKGKIRSYTNELLERCMSDPKGKGSWSESPKKYVYPPDGLERKNGKGGPWPN